MPNRAPRHDPEALIREISGRHPAVGLAIGVVRDGRLESFYGHGWADVASRAHVTENTVFRIASVTKLFSAVAVTQLWQRGLVDLDAPANDYLRAYRLVTVRPDHRPVTIRHLLTHSSGIPEVISLSDLLHPSWGPFMSRPACLSVRADDPLPPLGEYYRGRLRAVVEPGTAFAYTNHGVATLGQIVEDVSGMPLARYLREHVFDPLGMADTDLARSERLRPRLATGYVLGPRGPVAAPDRDWITTAASAGFSTTRDLARFAAALLGGGSNADGSILRPETLAVMFEPHFQPDPRLPGMGLGFFRSRAGEHLMVGHDGRMPGFNADLLVAPDDGFAVIGLTNGSPGATTWLPIELEQLLRRLIGAREDAVRTDLPHHPETWGDLCGRYVLPPRISDLRGRLGFGGGVEVFVGGGRLMARLLVPVPALYRGFLLHPDDPEDPRVFRLDLTPLGMPPVRVAFSGADGTPAPAIHTDLGMLSFYRKPEATARAPLLVAAGGLALAASAIALRRIGRG
ncbi:MAG TPA: serine hydrolase domain-containing protein [Candidatus Limnocylindria bacterium]